MIYRPLLGIQGRVSENGNPVSGVPLELRFYNGSSWSTLANTTTASNGAYVFQSVPSLGLGQRYYVRYTNATLPNRLYTWHTRVITAYTAGETVSIGDFDIANINLTAPTAGATVSLPQAFHWTPRSASQSDSYEFDLFEPNTGDPYFFTDPLLGYASSYTLNRLPPGFGTGTLYVWDVWAYSPDGGYGISYYAYTVRFSNAGAMALESKELSTLRVGDLFAPALHRNQAPMDLDLQ
jgi:hypothetical protein